MIYLLNLQDQFTLKYSFEGHSHGVTTVDIHPNGGILISAGVFATHPLIYLLIQCCR